MSRYEIEDIISQDKRGIVFRAHDGERGHTVALRRFFPFGQDGGGLSEEEAGAFGLAAQSLEGISHASLRSVIAGSVDPIDRMPYIVAEWIDGLSLDTVLDGRNMEPPQVAHLLRKALEVSLTLSKALGEESVWVETEADSIFVGSEGSGRGFVFWLSPFKWLGAEFGSRNLSAIVDLGEQLAGWNGKLITDSAGNGLGGWLKWMRNNPDTGLTEALEALASRTGGGAAPPAPPPPASPGPLPFRPVAPVKPSSSKPTGLIAVAVCLALAIAGLVVYQKVAKARTVPPQTAEQGTPPPAKGNEQPERTRKAVAAEPRPAKQTETPVADVNARAAELAREKEAALAAAKAPPVPAAPPKNPPAKPKAPPKKQTPATAPAAKPGPQAPPATVAPPVRDLTPGDGDKMKALKEGGPVTVTGIVRNVRHSKAGNSLYFDFSNPALATEISAVAFKNEYAGDFTTNAYKDLIGKKVRFGGTVFLEKDRQYVKISTRKKIRVVQ